MVQGGSGGHRSIPCPPRSAHISKTAGLVRIAGGAQQHLVSEAMLLFQVSNPSGIVTWSEGQSAVMLQGVSIEGLRHLAQVVQTLGAVGALLGSAHHRQQQACQQRGYPHRDHQFLQRETILAPVWRVRPCIHHGYIDFGRQFLHS